MHNVLKAVYLISTFILFFSATAQAQTVKGTVRDSETSEPLAGVVVMFERVVDDPGANMVGTQTEADGTYSLQIPEGIEGVLGLYFISYDDLKSEVIRLGKGEELVLDLNMRFQSETLEAALVVARSNPESFGALVNDRKISAQAVENIGADEISIKGLSNVAEAVETMSGVSFNNSGQLFVRGLGDRYSLTTLNGLPVASPNPDNKLIPLDIFSSSVLQNITVTKVYTATSFADYSGAHIDIATKESVGESFVSVAFGLGGVIGTTFTDTYRPDRRGWLLKDNNLPNRVRDMSLLHQDQRSVRNHLRHPQVDGPARLLRLGIRRTHLRSQERGRAQPPGLRIHLQRQPEHLRRLHHQHQHPGPAHGRVHLQRL